MLRIRYIIVMFLFVSASLDGSDFLKTTYSFSNVSVNYVDWSATTQKRAGSENFPYVEYERGSGYGWGETYILVDVRNPTKSYDENSNHKLAFALKPTLDIKLKSNFAFHIQDYHLQSHSYRTNDAVVGFSYKLNTAYDFWAKPFLGYHYKNSTYYTGKDGYMFGWLFNYSYKQFSIFNWHEMTFDRDRKDGYAKEMGTQGSLKFWWNTKQQLSLGVQYRYAFHELGSNAYQWAYIYSLKYNF